MLHILSQSLHLGHSQGRKADIEAHAKGKGISVNGYVNTLIREDMGLSEAEWKDKEDTTTTQE